MEEMEEEEEEEEETEEEEAEETEEREEREEVKVLWRCTLPPRVMAASGTRGDARSARR
jgi:hypothetical protein